MTIRHFAAATLIAVLAACHARSSADTVVKPDAADVDTEVCDTEVCAPDYATIEITPEAVRMADSVLATLSDNERIAQLFVPRLDVKADAAGYAMIKSLLSDYGMGGILFGKGSVDTYAKLLNYTRKHTKVPPMVTFDGEWGLAMRIPDAPRFPYAMALGATRRPDLMEAYGREIARECRLMGVQVNFAPDLDVNSNPANPVIGHRSLGGDAENVGRLGAAYCIGMSRGNVMTVGKHFPGHGDTSVDSHKALPTVDHTAEQMTATDMLPFRICIEAGMPAVMIGHLRVPALDPDGTPASLSSAITEGRLRDSLQFKGLIFTDALAMKGATDNRNNNCVSALLAGADLLLGSGAPVADYKAVKKAVAEGLIAMDTITARCRRVLIYKYALDCHKAPHLDAASLKKELETPECSALIDSLCATSITLLSNRSNIIPLHGESATVVVIGSGANTFVETIREARPDYRIYTVGKATPLSAATRKSLAAGKAVVVITAAEAWAVEAYKTALRANPDLCAVFLTNAYRLTNFPADQPGAEIVTYDCFPAMARAAARAILGETPITGRMPVEVPGRASIGQGITIIP